MNAETFLISGFSIVIKRNKKGRNEIRYLESVPKFGVERARNTHNAET